MQQEYNIIELDNCTLYRNDFLLLKDISWKIKEKEHYALIGPNGSGKTTLLKIISGYLWPSSGKVNVLGKEFGKADLRELRKKIGWVTTFLLEKFPLNEKTIDVVLSGKFASFGIYQKINKEERKKAEEMLGFLGVSYLKDRKLHVVSQGELQKIMIARALMADPLLLILDEPCTGLDIKARKNLLDSVSMICNEKTTVIYVTHHFEEIVPEINKILMLREGKIFMQGDKAELFNEKIIKELFE